MSKQTETEATLPVRRVATRRAVIIGLLLIPLNIHWLIIAEFRWYNILTLNPLFVTPVFYLFVLAGVNALLRRFAPKHRLDPGELVVIYAMLVISCTIASHDYIINLMATMTWAKWSATPSNGMERDVLPLLPRWLIVNDRNALAGYFTGNANMYDLAVLRAWIVPAAFWSGFMVVCGRVMLCLSSIFRKAWVDDTRLSFPIVRLPLALLDPDTNDSTLRSRGLWIGFAVVAAIDVLNGLQMWYPNLPHVQTRAWFLEFKNPPWSAMGALPVTFYPFAIGLGYLVPLDVSFSCWFFHLFIKAQSVIGYQLGYGSVRDFPFQHEQGIGAWFAFGIMLLYMSRKYLRSAWRSALDPQSKREPDEAMSYRAAFLGLGAGVLLLIWFWRAAGMGSFWTLFTIGVFLLVSISITRVRAEAGGQHAVWDLEPINLAGLFGSNYLGPGNMAASALSHWFWRLQRSHIMPSQLECLKLAKDCRLNLRSLVRPLILALVLSVGFGFWSCLHVGYSEGALAKCLGNPVWTANESFGWLQNSVHNGLHPETGRWAAVGSSALFVTLLSWLRTRYEWFPFHPLGYCIGNELRWHWTPFFVAWLAKLLVLRYGGLRMYSRTLPFFLGLVLGDYITCALWSLVGALWNVPTYQMFH